MNRNIIALALLASLPLVAGQDPKTLPSNVYGELKSGNKLDKVWRLNPSQKLDGFAITPSYKAEKFSAEVKEYFVKSANELSTKDSKYRLELNLVHLDFQSFALVMNAPGHIVVEGTVTNADGKIVAAFSHKTSFGRGSSGVEPAKRSIDEIVSAINQEFR